MFVLTSLSKNSEPHCGLMSGFGETDHLVVRTEAEKMRGRETVEAASVEEKEVVAPTRTGENAGDEAEGEIATVDPMPDHHASSGRAVATVALPSTKRWAPRDGEAQSGHRYQQMPVVGSTKKPLTKAKVGGFCIREIFLNESAQVRALADKLFGHIVCDEPEGGVTSDTLTAYYRGLIEQGNDDVAVAVTLVSMAGAQGDFAKRQQPERRQLELERTITTFEFAQWLFKVGTGTQRSRRAGREEMWAVPSVEAADELRHMCASVSQ